MERIIIASKTQYGYLTDTYKYVKILKNIYNITYICFDDNLPKIDSKGVEVIYLKKVNSLFLNLLMLNMVIVKENYRKKTKLIFSVYNPLNFISKLFIFNTRMILDIRTGEVNKDTYRRNKANKRIKFNSLFFKEITIISDSLAKFLKIKNYKVLPLGADYINKNINKNLEEFNLLYIGVLSNREINKTVNAVIKFNDKYKDLVKVKYNIIGYFKDNNSLEAVEFFKQVNESECIKYLGRKKHDELNKYFNESNIGVSFIPITEYYNYQPPTKTFEYLSQGLVTIATKTYENERIINDKNGVLCNDNEVGFYKALEYIYENRSIYNSNIIKESIKEYDWNKITNEILIKIIEK